MSFVEGSLEKDLTETAKPRMKSLLRPVVGVGRRPHLETRLIDGILLMQPPFPASIPSINLISKPIYHGSRRYIAHILQIWSMCTIHQPWVLFFVIIHSKYFAVGLIVSNPLANSS